MVLKSTMRVLSTPGKIKNNPGPLAPISRPKRKITALSYSLTILIEDARIDRTIITRTSKAKIEISDIKGNTEKNWKMPPLISVYARAVCSIAEMRVLVALRRIDEIIESLRIFGFVSVTRD